MPWKEIDVVDQRLELVLRSMHEATPFKELCREYGVTAKTGYKWRKRFLKDGATGLADASRRPRRSPTQLDEATVCELVRTKTHHPTWGARKVREVYARNHPEGATPSESSVKRVLDKAGLVQRRARRRSPTCGRIQNPVRATAPNDVWTVDFKGWWRTAFGQRCEPLTVRDHFSRYILCADPLENGKYETVRERFERIFRTYGLPAAIRSDNGTPFASSQAPLGLSRLSAWWVALGVNLDRIDKGRPDQNGGHERMHRDIAAELEGRIDGDLGACQAALETWRCTFNDERPHEAIGMRVPSELYEPSSRAFQGTPDQIVYPQGLLTRQVGKWGAVRVHGVRVWISSALAGWSVGLKPVSPERLLVWFGPLTLGVIDLKVRAMTAADGAGA